MARRVCSTCGRTLSRMDFVRGRAHRTAQGYYCHDCFSSMLSDISDDATTSSEELEEDLDLLGALEESLPEDGLPAVEGGHVDPGAETISAPAPERPARPSDSTLQSVREEFGEDEKEEPEPAPKKKRAGRAKQKRRGEAPREGSRSLQYLVAAVLTILMLVLAWLVFTWG